MKTEQHYDLIVIGAGQSGDPLARAFADAGRKTVLIERAFIGGTCINYGCTPTKTMVASARVAYLAHRAGDYGVNTGSVTVDMEKIRKRKRETVESFRTGDEHRIQRTKNLELIYGTAAFSDPKTVTVALREGGSKTLTADTIVINTGTRSRLPKISGIDTVPTLDNTTIMELDIVPKHLVILGGGYIGLEFGQMFRRFGSEITIIQQRPQLLANEDEDVAKEIAKILREEGITIHLSTKATQVEQASNGEITLQLESPDGPSSVTGSHLLVAVGRVPNTEDLGLNNAEIDIDNHGFIKVNDMLETSIPKIYALGDVKGGPAFTHISYDDFRILRTNLLQDGKASSKGRLVPYTVFIDPQLGRVGLTEQEAKAQGKKIKVAKLPMTSVARALETDETGGFMKAIVDAETDQILGAAVLGTEGGETMAVLQVAMMGKLPYTALKEGIFSHPTFAESLNNLFLTLD